MNPSKFVQSVYVSDYVSGFICLDSQMRQYLLVWFDSEVHVWGLDDEGNVIYPKNRPIDPASQGVGIHHDIMEASDFLGVISQYKE